MASSAPRPDRPAAGVPVFLDRHHDRVTGIALECDGLVLPIDSITALHRQTRRRHELAWALPPLAALALAGWPSTAALLGALLALVWWKAPPLQLLALTLRDGQRLRLLKTADAERVDALNHALAKALAHRWVQTELAARAHTLHSAQQAAPRRYEPAWRDTDFDAVHDSAPGALPGGDPQPPDVRL